jgi:chemotaxis protein CheX
MDVKVINPFVASITSVLPQLGFQNIVRKDIKLKSKKIKSSGVIMVIGIVGDRKGNVAYGIDMEGAKKIASIMMMGMPVNELDDMSKSALSELSNMLTANASINFSNDDINVDISVPTLMYGDDIEVNMNSEQIVSVGFDVDGVLFEINVALN